MTDSPRRVRALTSCLCVGAVIWLSACAATTDRARGGGEPQRAGASGPAEGTKAAALFAGPPMPPPTEARPANGAPGPGYWQQRVDYDIEATLDADARRITGTETLTYTNNSPQPLAQLWLALEQNLFTPESGGAGMSRPNDRFGNRDVFKGGFQDVVVTIDGAPVTLHVFDTIGRIDLPAPIAPRGGQLALTISWAFTIPGYGSDRMGIDKVADGEIFQIAQWFPAACVFDDVHGWNTLPYLGQGEFYTNLGSYDVRLTVPAGHLVAATGELRNPEEVLTTRQRERLSSARATSDTVTIHSADDIAGTRARASAAEKTWRFTADNVRTFAWASSPAFIWDACFVPGGGSGSDGDPSKGQGTLCQSFYPKEAAAQWKESTQMLRASLEHYGKMWYAYPYPTASNINGLVGGMEYPMIIFCAEREHERGLWGVTTHEIGHGWFPMLVNTDERRHAWMDEGFNTFMNYYATLERYPDDLPRRGNPRRWARDNDSPTLQPIDLPADQLAPGTLGAQQYGKTAVGLVLLREGVLGEERFDAAFREYVRRWAYRSPRPWDFFRTMSDASGEDLGWFFRGWFYETGTLDQAITTVMQPGGTGGAEGSAESRGARVTIVNKGQLIMPVSFKVEYEDGSTETRRLPVNIWAASDTWQTQWDTGGRRIRRVTLDPDENLPDVDLRNNQWP